MVNKEGFPTKEDLDKSLRETKRRIIRQYLGSDQTYRSGRTGERKRSPMFGIDPKWVQRISEDEIFFTDLGDFACIVREKIASVPEQPPIREPEIVWQYGEPGATKLEGARGAYYDTEKDKCVIGCSNKIVELDLKRTDETIETDSVTEITSTDLGNLGDVFDAKYNLWSDRPYNILFVDYKNHVAGEVKRDGTIVWSVGEYGTSGDSLDPLRLNKPRGIFHSYFHIPSRENEVFIADTYNNRVVQYNHSNDTVRYYWLALKPISVTFDRRGYMAITSRTQGVIHGLENVRLFYSPAKVMTVWKGRWAFSRGRGRKHSR